MKLYETTSVTYGVGPLSSPCLKAGALSLTLRRCLPRWQRQYQARKIPNQGYCTHGLLVPLDEFERIAQRVESL